MRKSTIILFVLSILYAVSCEKDLDVAEWKEISIIYGVINIKDTVQYIRINRVYSAPFDDPYLYTQVNDSVNYPHDRFQVFLEEYKNGQMLGVPIQYEAADRQKEPGLFSSESNCVYRTSTPVNEDCEYKLRVINNETGHETYATAEVLGGITIEESFSWERAFFRINYVEESLPEYDGSLDPVGHEHYIVRFLYWEYVGNETLYKYVDWVPSMHHLKNIGDDDDTIQMFDAYWKYISEKIEIDPTIKRRARGIDYMLALPGKELQTYIVVNEQPTNPHYFPDYSNMIDGEGVFGSKYFYTYFGLKLKLRTIDTISWGRHLIDHRFSDRYGEWH